MKIKLLSPGACVPARADKGAAGFDLKTPKDVTIHPGRNVVPLDFAIELNYGHEAHIRPRSGFSLKGFEGRMDSDAERSRFNADVIQGTVDASYRGNVGVIVKSHERKGFVVPAGTRIAQMVIECCYMGPIEVVDELDDTTRGTGGFGSTGNH